MTPIQKVIQAARAVKQHTTIPVTSSERFQVALTEGAYESLRRLARAVDDLDRKEMQ